MSDSNKPETASKPSGRGNSRGGRGSCDGSGPHGPHGRGGRGHGDGSGPHGRGNGAGRGHGCGKGKLFGRFF